MTAGTALLIIFALAFLIESSVEYIFGTPMDKIPKLTPYKWLLMYASMAAGVGMTFYYKVDMLSMIGDLAKEPLQATPVGFALSGLVIGRGANFVHQFVSNYLPVKK